MCVYSLLFSQDQLGNLTALISLNILVTSVRHRISAGGNFIYWSRKAWDSISKEGRPISWCNFLWG